MILRAALSWEVSDSHPTLTKLYVYHTTRAIRNPSAFYAIAGPSERNLLIIFYPKVEAYSMQEAASAP